MCARVMEWEFEGVWYVVAIIKMLNICNLTGGNTSELWDTKIQKLDGEYKTFEFILTYNIRV